MRPLPRRIPVLAASAVATVLITTGCSEVQQVKEGVGNVQQCLQATGIVTDTVKKITGLMDDPAAMEKALHEGGAKLGDLADKAANTTLKEAADGVADSLKSLNVKDANDAITAGRKVAADSVKWAERLTGACS
ncbi:hypothetical protein [Streptosporangium sp. NPDC087985]|uniref:hypothetical protein n=1 Tax=Streptosporangium sp. NPDC087985 TaxID=3366196 RepID=UPI0038071123